jgi:hypothetical protein
MRIAVIDGQGGGVGRALVEALRAKLPAGHTILALGTNALATAAMLKAGADEGATGENAISVNAARADVIAGPIGIVLANAMLGELTPAMARAVAESPARKVLLPMEKCRAHVVGAAALTMQALVEQAAEHIRGLAAGAL